MNKKIITLILVTLVSACTSFNTVKLDKKNLQNDLADKNVSVLLVEQANLEIVTPKAFVGNGLIARLTNPDGTHVAVPSPTYLVGKSLKDKVETININEIPNKITSQKNVEKVSKDTGGYTLSVAALANTFIYRPFAWNTYQYMMHAAGTLRDPQGKIIWQNKCMIGGISEDLELQLDKSEFSETNSDRLITVMNTASDRCADKFASDFKNTVK